jgi:hypothetical protein
MRGDANTLIYFIAAVIVLHFFVDLIWVAYKLNKKKDGDTSEKKY